MPNIADYDKGTNVVNEMNVKDAILVREKNDYQLWVLGDFASIVKKNDKPQYKRHIAGVLVYDWNALTGDNLNSID